jgi:tetratricopeptide (TPR) repeat protein
VNGGRSALLILIGLLLTSALASCEKETHRAARRDFQELMARDLPPVEQAAALEVFTSRYPEPKTNPYLVRALRMLAEYHARAGRPDIAASWYERAVLASPDDPDLLNVLGYHYAVNRMNLDRAVSLLETSARLAEDKGYPPRRLGMIKDSLGWAHRVRGDLPQAVALLDEACRLAPGIAILRMHLADTYRAIGEGSKAASVYLDLYLEGRATDARLRQTLDDIGRDGGPALSREIARRLEAGRQAIADNERRETEAEGASLIRLRASDGYGLAGSLYLPPPAMVRETRGALKSAGAVLLLPAIGSTRRSAGPLARTLAAQGLVALTLDLRGHGASVSESLPGPRQFGEHLAENLGAADQDVRAALAFLAHQPRVTRARLGVVGAGQTALLAARALDLPSPSAPVALVLLSPRARADAYAGHLVHLDPTKVLLVSGSEELGSATLEALARDMGAPGAGTLLIPEGGSAYDLLERAPGLHERVASFLAERLR